MVRALRGEAIYAVLVGLGTEVDGDGRECGLCCEGFSRLFGGEFWGCGEVGMRVDCFYWIDAGCGAPRFSSGVLGC